MSSLARLGFELLAVRGSLVALAASLADLAS